MFDTSADEITEGSLWRSLLLVASPLLAQNLVRVGQQLVDLFWLGRLGSDAVAAVGLASPLLTLVLALVIAPPFVGTQVLVSQRIGAGDDTGAHRVVFAGIALAVTFSVVGSSVLFFGVDSLVSTLSAFQPQQATSSDITSLTVEYIRVLTLGIVFAATGDVLEAAYIGRGNSRTSFYLNLTSVGVNVVLDPVLIFGYGPVPELGIQGAGLATVSGYLAGVLLGFAFVVRERANRLLTKRAVHADRDVYRDVLNVGVPPALQDATQQVIHIVMVAVVFIVGGATGLAAYSVSIRVASLSYIPARGLKQASQSIVGQNLGADESGRADRATRIGVVVTVGILGLIGAVQWSFPGVLTAVFVPSADAATVQLTKKGLRIIALGYPGLGALFVFQAAFNGASHTTTSLIASLVQYWGFRLPFAVLAGGHLGYGSIAVFWAVASSNVLAGLGLGLYYVYRIDDGLMRDAAAAASAVSSD